MIGSIQLGWTPPSHGSQLQKHGGPMGSLCQSMMGPTISGRATLCSVLL